MRRIYCAYSLDQVFESKQALYISKTLTAPHQATCRYSVWNAPFQTAVKDYSCRWCVFHVWKKSRTLLLVAGRMCFSSQISICQLEATTFWPASPQDHHNFQTFMEVLTLASPFATDTWQRGKGENCRKRLQKFRVLSWDYLRLQLSITFWIDGATHCQIQGQQPRPFAL